MISQSLRYVEGGVCHGRLVDSLLVTMGTPTSRNLFRLVLSSIYVLLLNC